MGYGDGAFYDLNESAQVGGAVMAQVGGAVKLKWVGQLGSSGWGS